MLRASIDGTTALPDDNNTLNAGFSIHIGFILRSEVSFEHKVGADREASWLAGEFKSGTSGKPCNFFRSGESSYRKGSEPDYGTYGNARLWSLPAVTRKK